MGNHNKQSFDFESIEQKKVAFIDFEKRNNASTEDKLMKRLLSIKSKSKSHMAYRVISAGLTPKERKKWDKEKIEKTLVKLAHMGFGETKGGTKGATYFKKTKDWED